MVFEPSHLVVKLKSSFSMLASFPGSLIRRRRGVDESLVSTALPGPVVFDML